MPWYDIVLLIAGPGAYFFYAVNAQNVVQMSARVMQNDLYMIIGLIGILALVELCRRCVGLPIRAWPVCCWCTPSSTWAAAQISR